ncbi:hypothetical protein GEV43_34260 [Actinomadura sp. J1-007]|uniref:DUF5691 domain-containing protein n=1 Tax=Actinomadura sp. J1-007 TaxID=2661913 RepID=UPI001326D9A6|nr:DUF5691 domain-containing protein [Actinomadura sp. J1-007]MWK38601.1 hypothetical protein [Actinomadura sp. J1-007]
MSGWNDHVSAALLGTERRPAPPPPLPTVPDDASGADDAPGAGDAAGADDASGAGEVAGAGDAAGRLLDQAALLAVQRRAGRVPERVADTGGEPGRIELIAPAPAEEVPAVPPAAAARLARILAGEQIRVLPEWLDAAAARGLRVPARLLPELLEKGRGDRMLRPSIARAAGRRGVWLALRNTDWAYLVGSGDDPGGGADVWETGSRNQRVAHLTRLRGTDPAAAREALRGTWAREPAPDRAAFLATFEHGLSPDDEEFLESALEDRGKDVRQLASDLLARLPGSAYGRRMADRARACLRPETRTVRLREQTWIVVEPPRAHDEDLARDGVPFHPSGSFAPSGRAGGGPVGTRAAWLREILARTPLETWTELFGLPPMEIVCLPVADAAEEGGRAARDVHIGWARAALRQRDTAWARALLKGGVVVDEPEALADLLPVLPAAERDPAAADLIRWVEGHPDLLRVLERVPGPWSGVLADAVVAILTAAARRPSHRHEHTLVQLCRLADQRLAPPQPYAWNHRTPPRSPNPRPPRRPLRRPPRRPARRPHPLPALRPHPRPDLRPHPRPDLRPSRRPDPRPAARRVRRPDLRPGPRRVRLPARRPVPSPDTRPDLRPLPRRVRRPDPPPDPRRARRPVRGPVPRPGRSPGMRPDPRPPRRPGPRPAVRRVRRPEPRPARGPVARPDPSRVRLPGTRPGRSGGPAGRWPARPPRGPSGS